MSRRVAFVTGASRGLGRAAARALAERGFDLVLAARTLVEGERQENSTRSSESELRALPGSLESSAEEVRALGREALPLRLDLLDLASIRAALERTLAEWGHIDVLVNNAVYTGQGTMDRVEELPLETLERIFRANVFHTVELVKLVLPGMRARKQGTILNLVSQAALFDPPGPPGEGGWGFAYSASKAALIRLANQLKPEIAGSGVHIVNVEPGVVITETLAARGIEGDLAPLVEKFGGAPPSVPAAVIAWLADRPGEAQALDGQLVFAQKLARERDLHPEWRAPRRSG